MLNVTKKSVFQICFATAFLVLLWSIPYQDIRVERVRAFGEAKAVGTVTNKSFSAVNSKVYYLTYSFVGPQGFSRTRTAEVTEKLWKSYHNGDYIEVIYAKAAPEIARIKGEVEGDFITFLALFSRKIQ